MVTTTKLMLNMMCGARMVKKPRSTPRLTHSVSNAAPRMISGAVMGMKISRFMADRPRNW